MTYRPGGSLPLRALARAIGSYDLIIDSGTVAPRDDADSTSAAACPEALRVKIRHGERFDVVNAREMPVDRYRDGSRDAMSFGWLWCDGPGRCSVQAISKKNFRDRKG